MNKTLIAMCCLTLLEVVAMITGNNGMGMMTCYTMIAALGGYEVRKKMEGVAPPSNE